MCLGFLRTLKYMNTLNCITTSPAFSLVWLEHHIVCKMTLQFSSLSVYEFLDIFFESVPILVPILWLGYFVLLLSLLSSLYIMDACSSPLQDLQRSFPIIWVSFHHFPPFLSFSVPLLHLFLLFFHPPFLLSFLFFWSIFIFLYSETKYTEHFITHVHCFT